MDAPGLDRGQRLLLRDDRPQSVAVEGIAVQCLGVQNKLAAFGLVVAGVVTETLQPNSYGALASPGRYNSTSGRPAHRP